MSFILKTPQEVLEEVRQRFKARRLVSHLTREGLAKRSGVNINSLKRFEVTGQISFESLLKLSLVLDCLNDFEQICVPHNQHSLSDILNEKKIPKKGTIK